MSIIEIVSRQLESQVNIGNRDVVSVQKRIEVIHWILHTIRWLEAATINWWDWTDKEVESVWEMLSPLAGDDDPRIYNDLRLFWGIASLFRRRIYEKEMENLGIIYFAA